MKKLPFLTLCLASVFVSLAQPDSTTSGKKQKSFSTSIRTLDNKLIKGRLYAINDSQVVLSNSFNSQHAVPAENIKSFSLKRKNNVLRGALIGFGIGAVTGIVMGLASGSDKEVDYPAYDPTGLGTFAAALNNAFTMTAGEKAVAAGLGLGAGGAIIGTIIGVLAKKKFIIGGRKEKFRDLQSEMMMKLVQN